MLAGAVGVLAAIAGQSASAQQQCTGGNGAFPASRYGEISLSEDNIVVNTMMGRLGALRPILSTFNRGPDLSQSDPIYGLSAAVGRLDVQWGDSCMLPCTATLLPDRTIVTARHCLVQLGNTRPRAARMVFNHYSQMDREGDVQVIDVDLSSIQVVQPLPGQTQRPDIAFARLRSAPTNITPLRLDERPFSTEGVILEIIQHPAGLRKHLSEITCRSVRSVGMQLYHRCDTVPGSSGSPIMSRFRSNIFAIHAQGAGHLSDPNDPGSRDHIENSGWLIAPFADQIRALYGGQGRNLFSSGSPQPVDPCASARADWAVISQATDQEVIRSFRAGLPVECTNLRNLADARIQELSPPDPCPSAASAWSAIERSTDSEAIRRFREQTPSVCTALRQRIDQRLQDIQPRTPQMPATFNYEGYQFAYSNYSGIYYNTMLMRTTVSNNRLRLNPIDQNSRRQVSQCESSLNDFIRNNEVGSGAGAMYSELDGDACGLSWNFPSISQAGDRAFNECRSRSQAPFTGCTPILLFCTNGSVC
jgi:hypothetical protein